MPKDRPDYINVRLSDSALAKLGADAQVRFSNAHAHYLFSGNDTQEVLRRPEWQMMQAEILPSGETMFQEAASVPSTSESLSSEE